MNGLIKKVTLFRIFDGSLQDRKWLISFHGQTQIIIIKWKKCLKTWDLQETGSVKVQHPWFSFCQDHTTGLEDKIRIIKYQQNCRSYRHQQGYRKSLKHDGCLPFRKWECICVLALLDSVPFTGLYKQTTSWFRHLSADRLINYLTGLLVNGPRIADVRG